MSRVYRLTYVGMASAAHRSYLFTVGHTSAEQKRDKTKKWETITNNFLAGLFFAFFDTTQPSKTTVDDKLLYSHFVIDVSYWPPH